MTITKTKETLMSVEKAIEANETCPIKSSKVYKTLRHPVLVEMTEEEFEGATNELLIANDALVDGFILYIGQKESRDEPTPYFIEMEGDKFCLSDIPNEIECRSCKIRIYTNDKFAGDIHKGKCPVCGESYGEIAKKQTTFMRAFTKEQYKIDTALSELHRRNHISKLIEFNNVPNGVELEIPALTEETREYLASLALIKD